MSGGSCALPVLWLSTNAVQLSVPIGDDGQQMSGGSGGPPVLWLSTNASQFSLRLRRAVFRSSFAFLLSIRQTFPFLVRCLPLFRFVYPISFLFSVLLSARHFLDGAVFRSVGNYLASQVFLNCFYAFVFLYSKTWEDQ